MKAAVCKAINQPLEIEDIQHGNPGPREVLVRTAATGVCHSDLHFWNGSYPYPMPTVLGHESAGVVEAVGSMVSYVQPGDHVISCISAFCGHCEYCLTGAMALCESPELQRAPDGPARLSRNDGEAIAQFLNLSSFAEYMLVHEHAIAKINPEMPLDRAALIGCSITTGVGAVIHTAAVEPGASVAVIGCGGIGLAAVNGAAIAGAGRIIAIDKMPNKLQLATRFGATDLVNADEADPVEAVRELTGGGVHYAFEAIGLAKAAQQAFKMVRRGGTATVIGMIPVGQMVEIHGPELLAEKKLQGCRMGSNRFRVDMPRFVDFYLQGKLHLDDMISNRIRLEDINAAFTQLESGAVARNIIVFD